MDYFVQSIKLIKTIKKHECLYNMQHPKYNKFAYKESLWATIAAENGLTVTEAKKKWKCLRDSYRKSKQIAASDTGVHKPYKYAKVLRFLDQLPIRLQSFSSPKTITTASENAEVSTDLSICEDFMCEPPVKQRKNSFDDKQHFLEATSNDDEDMINISNNMDWNLKLIEEVKKFECLYNMHCPEYKNVEDKKNIWIKVAKDTGITDTQAKKRWKSLRDCYKRYKQNAISERGIRKPYKYAEALRFLDDFSVFRQFCSALTPALDDVEFSTELSSNEEFAYDNFENRTKSSVESSFDDTDTQELEPAADTNLKAETSDPCTNGNQPLNIKERFESNLKLIDLVRTHECLYNVHCPQYKNLEYKENLWAKIGRRTGLTAIETKKKWKMFRDSYKRHKQIVITGHGFHKPYKYGEALRFLDDFSLNRLQCAKARRSALEDAEVSTDLSSNYDFEYDSAAQQTECRFEDSFDNMQNFLEASSVEENFILENSEKDVNADPAISNNKEISTKIPENSHNEDCTFSPQKPLVKEEELNEKLIDEVKKYDCLFNTQSTQYKNLPHKKRLWHRIGKLVGLTGYDAKKKWKGLIENYKQKRQYSKYYSSLRFLEEISLHQTSAKRVQRLSPEHEVSTDLSSDVDLFKKQEHMASLSAADDVNSNPDTMTSRLFQLLANKIKEANLTLEEKSDIEYTVSSAVYSKLAQYNKNKLKRL